MSSTKLGRRNSIAYNKKTSKSKASCASQISLMGKKIHNSAGNKIEQQVTSNLENNKS